MNLLPNYTGPYISDGKFQESVLFGDAEPKDKLDALSRLHDTAYAKYKDYGHRQAADKIYNEAAKKLVGQFPSLAGNLVLYGNQAGRAASNLASGLAYGPLGFIYGAVENMVDLNDIMINGDKYAKDINDLYETDPKKNFIGDELLPTLQNPTTTLLGDQEDSTGNLRQSGNSNRPITGNVKGTTLKPWQILKKVEPSKIENKYVDPLGYSPIDVPTTYTNTGLDPDPKAYEPKVPGPTTVYQPELAMNRSGMPDLGSEYSGSGGLRDGFRVRPYKKRKWDSLS